MSWKVRTKETMLQEFVTRALSGKEHKAALCREYGISRPTGDKWIKRYLEGESLEDLSRRPHTNSKQISGEVTEKILALRREYPTLGSRKIAEILKSEGVQAPCAKSIDNILHRNGLITPEASAAAKPPERFEKAQPNDLWQMDFKGHFQMLNHTRCHPLNILDDRSRFNIRTVGCDREMFHNVQPVLYSAFKEYGLPDSILCDNGNPWGVVQKTGYTALEVWLMDLDILTLHIRPYRPQTQGKVERFNQTFTRECLSRNEWPDMASAQRIFDEYRTFYNTKRPHEALGMQTPAQVYHESDRKFPSVIEPWEYPQTYIRRQVRGNGAFSLDGEQIFLSYGFVGKEIGIRPSHLPGLMTIEYRNFHVARFDPDTKKVQAGRIYRIRSEP